MFVEMIQRGPYRGKRECQDIEPGNDITIDDCDSDITLWQGKTNTLVCQATFNGLSDVGMTTRLITIEAEYGYYIDKSTALTITSR